MEKDSMWIVGVCMCIYVCVFICVCMWLWICIYVCICCCQTSSRHCSTDPCCCEEKGSTLQSPPPTHPSTFYALIQLYFSLNYFGALLHRHWQWSLFPEQDQSFFICSIVSEHCSIVKEIWKLWSLWQCSISFRFIGLVCAFLLLIDSRAEHVEAMCRRKTYPISVSNTNSKWCCHRCSTATIKLRAFSFLFACFFLKVASLFESGINRSTASLIFCVCGGYDTFRFII